jgi:2-hydroxy-3-oxopropionate reductase
MKIGFIGLGVMGAPMARHLAAAGHEIVTVLNRTLRGAEADYSSLAKALEMLSDHELSNGKE